METKRCTKCNKNKTLACFTTDRSQKDSLCRYCKICQKELNKAKRAKELALKVHIERNEAESIIIEEKYEKHCDLNYYIESNKCVLGI